MICAKVLADSMSPAGARLTTLEVTLPRIVLAEFNTHRMLSRGSASSRAIPVEKMIARVLDDPFVPISWGKNQKGMRADEELGGNAQILARQAWLSSRDEAVVCARRMIDLGVHKQIANRLLEPWLFHTVIATATEWANFFALRINENAQPEMRAAAVAMRNAMTGSAPAGVTRDGWHMPFVTPEETVAAPTLDWRMVSAGRCARVSYLTHDGVRDPQKDVELAKSLLKNGHMSPFEHVATPSSHVEGRFSGNFYGWVQLRKTFPGEHDFSLLRGGVS